MELRPRDQLFEWEINLINSSIPEDDLEDLLDQSLHFFEVCDDTGFIGFGGLLTLRLISDEIYVWLVLREEQLTRAQLRRGVKLARKFLASLPYKVLAETGAGNRASEKFAEAIGFHHLQNLEERNLYLWGK